MTAFGMLLLGFLLGIRHATEADHVAAVATLATRQIAVGETVRQGIAWGVGHTLTLVLFGGVILGLGHALPERVAQLLELAVGAMLVALGCDVLRRLARQRIHVHVHTHAGGIRHLHAHAHVPDVGLLRRTDAHRHLHAQRFPVRALAIGVMHGLAGSAALILLSLQAVQSFALGVLYIVLFGLGSIAGMALLSVAIAIPLRLSARVGERVHRGLSVAIGMFSIGLGAYIVCEVGSAGGFIRAWSGAA
jgi:high-affinity nickel permease